MAVFARTIGRWIVLEVIGRLLFYTGILYLIARTRRRFGKVRLLVPMYHHVERAHAGKPLLDIDRAVGKEEFEKHVRIYKWFGAVTTLEEGVRILRAERPVTRTVIAITFDDGYRDVYSLAFPILQRLGCSATVFPVVRSADGGPALWWDQLTAAARQRGLSEQETAKELARMLRSTKVGCHQDRKECNGRHGSLDELISQLLALDHKERSKVIEHFLRACGRNGGYLSAKGLYASWAELAQMARRGIEIGGHTIDHVVLANEALDEAKKQVNDCASAIANRIGRRPRSFAYPNGSYNDAVAELVKQAGYEQAVTVEHGINYRETDLYQLKRVPVGNERAFHLAFKLTFYRFAHG